MSPTEPTTSRLHTEISGGPHRSHERSACVVVIYGPSLGNRVDVGEPPVLIGRSDDADLNIPHRSVSRRHCQVTRTDAGYRVRDLGATNPTRVNDRPIANAEVELVDGDRITVGESIVKFVSRASVEARYHQEVYELATRDPLTGLCNRRHFNELMEKELARAIGNQHPLALGILDIDLFKQVNDRYGHPAGDEVLRGVAAVMAAQARVADTMARIGGEEFALVFPETSLADAVALADRLRAAIATTPFSLGGEPCPITVSIGLARLDAAATTMSQLMAAADAALYRAKNEGRNRVCSSA